jgi:hypothetical protein
VNFSQKNPVKGFSENLFKKPQKALKNFPKNLSIKSQIKGLESLQTPPLKT